MPTQITYQNPTYDPNTPRNVINQFQWFSTAEIFEVMEQNRHNFSILLVNVDYDNNTGNIIRSANAFGASEVILYGRKKFDRRASLGTEFYMKFKQVKFVEELDEIIADYDEIVGLENNCDNTVDLRSFQWDQEKRYLICVGQEGNGIPEEILKLCKHTLEIPQYGSVRSLNVGVSAGIVMYDYVSKAGK
jgi:tRNA G18 (ribose-2'-O)-methylase SpoU